MQRPGCLLPDYSGGSFVNLIASLVESRGGAARHAPLRSLMPAELAAARNVVLLIVDGLGDAFVRGYGPRGALARHRRGAIHAVFPSTTASAITTSYTGATPLEHGLTGWFTYFGAAGCVGAPLPYLRRGEKRRIPAPRERLYAEPTYFDGLQARAAVVTHRTIIDSIYNGHHCGGAARHPYERLDELGAAIDAVVRSGPERKFVYAYWPEFDTLSHQHGAASVQARAHYAEIDSAFGAVLDRLAGSDTLVVATADHGFVDSTPEESLELPPELGALLRFPLCGEPRVAFCHVQEGRIAEFIARARGWLGERAWVRPSGELRDEGWFGPGRAHPDFAERIGEVALVMRERYTIKDRVPGERRHLHIGNHGGTSEEEMMIPLIVAAA